MDKIVWGFKATSFMVRGGGGTVGLGVSGGDGVKGTIMVTMSVKNAETLVRAVVGAGAEWSEVEEVNGGRLLVKREEETWWFRQELRGGEMVSVALLDKALVMAVLEELGAGMAKR